MTTASLRRLPKESQLLFPGDKDTNRPQVSSYNPSFLLLLPVLLRGRTADVVSCYGNPALSGKEQGRMRVRAGMGKAVGIEDLHGLIQGNQYAEVISSLHHHCSVIGVAGAAWLNIRRRRLLWDGQA